MPNIKGGKNYKKSKKGGPPQRTGDAPIADTPDKTYASVKKRLGGKRIEVICADNKERQANIPGTFYKRVWFNPGDVILVQIDPLDPKEVFILYKYMPNESSHLKAKGLINFDIGTEDDDVGIVFGESEDEEEEDVYDQVEKVTVSKEKEKEEREKNAVAKSVSIKGARANKTKTYEDENGEIDIDAL